jgi:chloramphenicol 3-O-phosphotransferase
MMLNDRSPMDDARTWRKRRRASAALADQFVRDGIELVIMEGTSWTQSERDEFASHLTNAVYPLYVPVSVSIEEALRRAEDDPVRRASRLPDALRASHADFAAVPLIPGDVNIDSTTSPVDHVVATIKQELQRPGPGPLAVG